MNEWMMDSILTTIIILMFIGLFVGIPLLGYSVYRDSQRESFDLKKDDWKCTLSHQYSSTFYIKAGNVMVPQATQTTVCDQWSRK